jgi:hypothetical protein
MRTFGELLGFDATRPEQEADSNSTLDVLWNAKSTRHAILIELKTKKAPDKAINKSDVGQGFNHLEWAQTELAETTVLGLVFVAYSQECTRDASPSERMWVASLDKFRPLYEETIQMPSHSLRQRCLYCLRRNAGARKQRRTRFKVSRGCAGDVASTEV